MSRLNPDILFRCRLIVGRYGEMDIAKWWNTSGILSPLGRKVASRGLPRTEFFSRARALFAVAAHRTQVFFSPPQFIHALVATSFARECSGRRNDSMGARGPKLAGD